MKPRILVFGWDDTAATRKLAESLRGPGCVVYLRTAQGFRADVLEPCERIVFTDGVKESVRAVIRKAYHDDHARRLELKASRDKAFIWTPPEFPPPDMGEVVSFRHVTQGRWGVFRGKDRISYPHTKDEARELAGSMGA